MRHKLNSGLVSFVVMILSITGFCSFAEDPPGAHQPDAGYVLGADDLISVHVMDADEMSDKPVRIDGDGYIRLPLAGRLKASGLTLEQLEVAIAEPLKTYIKVPQVTVSVLEFHSQRVSVLGAVKSPGIHQLEGHRTVVEVIALAGGLSDDAGNTLEITRRIDQGRIPLPNAVDDPTGQYSVAAINLKDILNAKDPAQNISIAANDVISVPRAKMVYVIGSINRPGGYVLGEEASFSVLKVVSLAGGLDHNASPKRARILRQVANNADRQEMPVNLKNILAGKAKDVPLQPEDILLIPANGAKTALGRTAEAAVQITTGLAIYRF